MFIRKVKKRNGRSPKLYEYLYLVESVRTEHGPRQKLILNLGALDIPQSQYKALAQRIEDILTGRESFFKIDDSIEKIAQQAANKIFRKHAKESDETSTTDYQEVDINSMNVEHCRSIGAEYVCHSIWNELKLTEFFLSHGIKKETLPIIEALILGRLISPGSERHIHQWVNQESALYELIGEPRKGGLNSFYRNTDRIFRLKDKLESHLSQTEKDLFSLKEQYCFFDLTNTYFEGSCKKNPKAAYGKSKERRDDCKLVTLGLVVDEFGFAKSSNLYSGNTNDAKTLKGMIDDLDNKTGSRKEQKTIVMDAGIASEENIKWLKGEKYHYIVVNRGKAAFEYDFEDMEVIKEGEQKEIEIKVKRYEYQNEVYILCHSKKKQQKERSIRHRMEQLFIGRLNYYKEGLSKKGRTKSYYKMIELIGRLKEKYPKVAKLYTIEIVPEKRQRNDRDMKKLKVKDILWQKRENYEYEEEKEGSYILRTDRTDLTNKEIWNLYIMLRRIEYSFLSMKSHLGFRPNFHQLERRVDAHLFISVIAYHIMHIIEYKLQQRKDNRRWATIRDLLKTHSRVTITFNRKMQDGAIAKQIIRLTTKLEETHADIYMKLNLNGKPLPRKILMKNR